MLCEYRLICFGASCYAIATHDLLNFFLINLHYTCKWFCYFHIQVPGHLCPVVISAAHWWTDKMPSWMAVQWIKYKDLPSNILLNGIKCDKVAWRLPFQSTKYNKASIKVFFLGTKCNNVQYRAPLHWTEWDKVPSRTTGDCSIKRTMYFQDISGNSSFCFPA